MLASSATQARVQPSDHFTKKRNLLSYVEIQMFPEGTCNIQLIFFMPI